MSHKSFIHQDGKDVEIDDKDIQRKIVCDSCGKSSLAYANSPNYKIRIWRWNNGSHPISDPSADYVFDVCSDCIGKLGTVFQTELPA